MSILTYRDLLTRHPDDWTLHDDLAVAHLNGELDLAADAAAAGIWAKRARDD